MIGDLDAYMEEIKDVPLLTREEEIDLAFQARAGDPEARARLVRANLRFVVKVAHEWKGYGLPLADLVAEGNVGLTLAATKFDPVRGFRFITFAVWQIRACIGDYVMRTVLPVRALTTQGARRVFWRLGAARKALGEGATPEALAEFMNEGRAGSYARASDVEEIAPLMAAGPPVPFDYAPDGALSLAESLPDAAASVDDELGDGEEAAELQEDVADALACLSARERYIVRLRHMGDCETTRAEIGRHLGVSRQRVKQLEERALEKLRRRLVPRAA